jgi:NAD+ kinase
VSTTSVDPAAPIRRVLLLSHTGRDAARDVTISFCKALAEHDIVVRLLAQEAADLGVEPTAYDPPIELVDGDVDLAVDCELAVVVGGDGSILRAAEVTWGSGTPVLGVNLGHVGFLAEAEREDLGELVDRVIAREYIVEERMTIDVTVRVDGEVVASTWALNEASVEKASRERMLEVVAEVDGRPLSRWGCDGVVCATPTGSTAYAFSAGGPVVWPEVEALLMIPISAHALFSRPIVVSPRSRLAVEVQSDTPNGVLWVDGRRTWDLPPGARVEVCRGTVPVRLARLHQAPFTDRLVRKFELPVRGWRGAAAYRRDAGT